MADVVEWAWWMPRLGWTVATLLVSWGLGVVVGAVVAARLPRWLPERHAALTAVVARTLRTRLRWWSMLIGAWVAAGYWPLTLVGSLFVGRAVFLIGAVSVTFTAAAIAAHLVMVTEVSKEVMAEVPGGVPDFDPFIRYHTFADSSVNFTVILRAAKFVDQYLIKHEFIKRLHARFTEEGIVIPFPIRSIVAREAGSAS